MTAENEALDNDDNDQNPDTPTPQQEAGGEPAGDNPAEDVTQALAELQAKADEHWELYVRTSAELENVRRRSARDLENAHKYGVERFAQDILNVKDTLEMGLELQDGQEFTLESLQEGSKMTLKMLTQTLERFGVSEIDPVGEPFDPEFHEALSMQPSPDAEPDTVLHVVQKGYRLHDRLLRPARVVVAKGVEATGN